MWIGIENVPIIANYTDVNAVIENQVFLAHQLSDLGIESGVVLTTASPNMTYDKIPAIYELIERNLDKLNQSEFSSAYYVEPFERGEYEPNKQEWQRWIDVINDIYNILNGTSPRWSYLLLSDGMPTIDGKKILLRGEYLYG